MENIITCMFERVVFVELVEPFFILWTGIAALYNSLLLPVAIKQIQLRHVLDTCVCLNINLL